jgi:hypothetical protein
VHPIFGASNFINYDGMKHQSHKSANARLLPFLQSATPMTRRHHIDGDDSKEKHVQGDGTQELHKRRPRPWYFSGLIVLAYWFVGIVRLHSWLQIVCSKYLWFPWYHLIKLFPRRQWPRWIKAPRHLAMYCGSPIRRVDLDLLLQTVSELALGTTHLTLIVDEPYSITLLDCLQYDIYINYALIQRAKRSPILRVNLVGKDGCERLKKVLEAYTWDERQTQVTGDMLRQRISPDFAAFDLLCILNDHLIIRGCLPLHVGFCEIAHFPCPSLVLESRWRLRCLLHYALRQYSRCQQNHGK